MRRPVLALLVLLACCLLAVSEAASVILAQGDGSQNTTPPSDDPGFDSVGVKSNLSVVYLGNRWVVTANHVGIGNVLFGGQLFEAIPGSTVRMIGVSQAPADLIVFRLYDEPPVPVPALATATPPLNAAVTLIGHGRNRGAPTQWMGIDGWEWGVGTTLRWGTNRVSDPSAVVFDTQSFVMEFDAAGALADECQAAAGDSGGAVFRKSGASWSLVGLLFAVGNYGGQPASTALYGNQTIAVDLSAYRDQILAVVDQPSCSDGLDDDRDGLVDYPQDPGCDSALDTSERSPDLACDDGLDNDGDGAIDFPADLQCDSPSDPSEEPAPAVPLLGSGALWLLSLLLLAGGSAAARSGS